MSRQIPLVLVLLAASVALPAQGRGTLLFTSFGPEFTLLPHPPSLQSVDPNDVMAVTPALTPVPVGADKWAPLNAWCALIGDEDADGAIWERALAGGQIDALLWTIRSDYPALPRLSTASSRSRSKANSASGATRSASPDTWTEATPMASTGKTLSSVRTPSEPVGRERTRSASPAMP